MADNNIKELVIIITLIFLIAPVFLLVYVAVYNRRKRKHQEEKVQMKLAFDTELIKAQLEVQEQTMQTIGADLHDNIGQLLSLTSLTLKSIEPDDTTRLHQKIENAIDLTTRSIKEMRLLGKLLQGDQLMTQGLSEAIKYEINWMERSGLYHVDYTLDCDQPLVPNPDKDLIVFRILQEILNNIIKHASATQIGIKLICFNGELQLFVKDNGIGFNINTLPDLQKGMGLLNIQKRAKIIGGMSDIKSEPDKGTTIIISIPYA